MLYLSICIPTYQRIEITRKTIASIYADLDGVNINEFEVIVSDNDPSASSCCFVEEFPYDNFHYFQTKCEGFLNSYNVLAYGNGVFLKLHNNYTMLKPGSLKYLIEEVKLYLNEKPEIFYTNGLRRFRRKKEYHSFDDYMFDLSYFSSWSTGLGIWKEDYDAVKDSVVISKMFPQTSMFLSCSDKELFVLNDGILFADQAVPKKGGYNPYYVFGVEYIDLIKSCCILGRITQNTFKKIKRDVLCEYLSTRYFKTVIARMDSFDHSNIKKHLSVNYSSTAYINLIGYALLSPFRYLYYKLISLKF